MMRCSFVSGLVLTLVATMSYAQQGPRGGGFGGAGGGAMTAASLVGIAEVQAELKVTDAQKPQLEELRTQMQTELRSARQGVDFQAMRDMSQEERTKAMADLRAKTEPVNKKFDAQLEKILDTTQMKRLKQLRTQRMGAAAFSNTEIVTALSLTDDQKTKVKEIQAAARPQGGAGAFNPDATPEERQAAMAKMRETRAKALKDMIALLTPDQAKTWADLTGPEFKFPQGRGVGGGGGRRGQNN